MKVVAKCGHNVIQTYNKMLVGFRIQVEWGINELKNKMETFHELVWLHKIKTLTSFQRWGFPHQLFMFVLNGFHILDHWRLQPQPYYTRVVNILIIARLKLPSFIF